jgi:hypothetical protein
VKSRYRATQKQKNRDFFGRMILPVFQWRMNGTQTIRQAVQHPVSGRHEQVLCFFKEATSL